MTLLICFLFLVSPLRERDRSEDKHLRDEFRARVRHRHGKSALSHRWSHFNRNSESLTSRHNDENVYFSVAILDGLHVRARPLVGVYRDHPQKMFWA